MVWKFTNDRPIYAQIVEQIQLGIVSGSFLPGAAMPSVRVLAVEAEVNPNTMQKALAELETQGLLHTQRTAGRTVTEDEQMIIRLREKLAEDYIIQFFTGMQSLGIGRTEAITMLSGITIPDRTPDTESSITREVN
ncbi:MAG: GntR family transcriptional regulator [Clostridiales Family XIII bacterium]|nr:GntR family transcriptional regulator [Clostridiales Family XIII bacterium]